MANERIAMKRFQSSLAVVILILFLLCTLAGCDSNGDDGVPDDFELVGTWAVTEVEGAPGPVDASNSTWTFRPDGTYRWFFLFPPFFDLSGSGNYSLDGRTLTTSGIFANTVVSESPDGRVTLSLGENTFSFRDDDGDRWTYVRQ
jgi:hypothetical protein